MASVFALPGAGQPPSVQFIVRNSRQMKYLPNYIWASLGKLYPELQGKGRKFDMMELCVTELLQNPVEVQSRLPMWAYLERREGALYCMIRQSEPYENPSLDSIRLPADYAERGRGRCIVYTYTCGNIWFNGPEGETSFELDLEKGEAVLEAARMQSQKKDGSSFPFSRA